MTRRDNVEWHKGVAARRAGAARDTNPYLNRPEDSDCRWARWDLGYTEGK